MDFPGLAAAAVPLHLPLWSRYSALWELGLMTAASIGSTTGTWPAADKAVYVPVFLPFAYTVRRVFWFNGSSVTSANVDFGIYTKNGDLLYSTGSTAMAGANAIQYVTLGTELLLAPGRYYFGIAMSSVTAGRSGRGLNTTPTFTKQRLAGMLEEAAALPLPAVATFAAITAQIPVPNCGITRTASGF